MLALSRSEKTVIVFLLGCLLLGLGLKFFSGSGQDKEPAAIRPAEKNAGAEARAPAPREVTVAAKTVSPEPEKPDPPAREERKPVPAGMPEKQNQSPAAAVNVNVAGAEELQTLPGIGPVLAQRIVEYRTQNGLFQEPDDLQLVKGIGARKFERLKTRLVLK